MWRSERSLGEAVLSFHHIGPRDWSWAIRLGSGCLCPRSHHSNLSSDVFKQYIQPVVISEKTGKTGFSNMGSDKEERDTWVSGYPTGLLQPVCVVRDSIFLCSLIWTKKDFYYYQSTLILKSYCNNVIGFKTFLLTWCLFKWMSLAYYLPSSRGWQTVAVDRVIHSLLLIQFCRTMLPFAFVVKLNVCYHDFIHLTRLLCNPWWTKFFQGEPRSSPC